MGGVVVGVYRVGRGVGEEHGLCVFHDECQIKVHSICWCRWVWMMEVVSPCGGDEQC